jgi:two-component system chemotaxis sensor kinase CheA
MTSEDRVHVLSFADDCLDRLERTGAAPWCSQDAGESPDPLLVSSLFIVAQSIKSGAGLFGCDTVKHLSQLLENALYMLRDKTLLPSQEVCEVLRAGLEKLTELLKDILHSESISISSQISQLSTLIKNISEAAAGSPETASVLVGPSRIFEVDAVGLAQARSSGGELYFLEYSLGPDKRHAEVVILEALRSLQASGRLVDCRVGPTAEGDQDPSLAGASFQVLLSTILEPKYVSQSARLPIESVKSLADGAAESFAELAEYRVDFGQVALSVKDRAGRIAVPAHVDVSVLINLRLALLGAMNRCARLVVDVGGLSLCDVFFYQMLYSALRTYGGRGILLAIEGTPDEDLLSASASMGFCGHNSPDCLFIPAA